MNFGNGGYCAHTNKEYCVVEEMDHACGMGADIIKTLGTKQFKVEPCSIYGTSVVQSNGTKTWIKNPDSDFFRQFSSYATPKSAKTTKDTSKTKVTYDVEEVGEMLGLYITNIQKQIETKCKENDIDFTIFAKIFTEDNINNI